MKQLLTTGIVLARTNYGEADRILTVLTPDHGKLRLLAKGVRRSKSKMAGGIELFSVAEISYIQGKGELRTLTSSRLKIHYEKIVQDITRTMLGYELIKLLNKVTEDQTESAYFDLLIELFEALHDDKIPINLVSVWFYAQLLRQAGHTPNLRTDSSDKPLQQEQNYMFSYDDMIFEPHPQGVFNTNAIKFLRLLFSGNKPAVLHQVKGAPDLTEQTLQVVRTMLPSHIRV